ncbi:MAG: YegS/Rv2252/BmrU family lipid kinase [Holdemanella sp.]|nr:YegS/Rv2252/BmrU family lipid kinase [Holdemanella sp.]
MKTVFILNPISDSKGQYRLMEEIKKNFKDKEYIIEKSKEPKNAMHIARKYALEQEECHIFACGGDGTIHEVANGIAGYKNVKLSVYPIGTGNDFVKYFEDHTKEDFLDLSRYKNAKEIQCDLLQVDGEYAINTVSFGFDVFVAQHVNEFRDKLPIRGILPYYMGVVKSLTKPLYQTYRIQIDDIVLPTEEYSLVVFTNGRFYGGGYKPCPEARIDDGKQDVCLVKRVNILTIAKLIKKYEKGLHTEYKDLITITRANKTHIDTQNEGIPACLDGEIRPIKNPTIELKESMIRLVVPGKEEA